MTKMLDRMTTAGVMLLAATPLVVAIALIG